LPLFAFALFLAGIQAQQPGLAPVERRPYIVSFEYVWKTIRDRHWDPKLNGVDWRAIHDELRPGVEKAQGRSR
jgi:hypothetical protein